MTTLQDMRWNSEVEDVKDQLVKAGVPPFRAMEKAVEIVSKRRREAAKLDDLPDDVRQAVIAG